MGLLIIINKIFSVFLKIENVATLNAATLKGFDADALSQENFCKGWVNEK